MISPNQAKILFIEKNSGIFLFAFIILFQITFLIFVNPFGPLTWDSGTYYIESQAFYKSFGFYIDNGLGVIESEALEVGHTNIIDGNLVSQYPAFYAIIAFPFWFLLGHKGLFLLSSIAFIAINLLIFKIAKVMTLDKSASVYAVLTYSFCTFAWVYSQSDYPHLLSTFLIVLAFYLLWTPALGPEASKDSSGGMLCWRGALAALVLGVAVGIRVDSVFAAPVLIARLFSKSGIRWRLMLSMALGGLIPIAALAGLNDVKFGTLNPFSYGRSDTGATGSIWPYVPIGLLILAGFLGVEARRRFNFLRSRWVTISFLTAALAAVLVTQPGWRLLTGMYEILVDMRVRPMDKQEAALSRTAEGSVVYFGNVKKAFFQSCPFLVLVIWAGLRDCVRRENVARGLLFLVPISFAAFYGYLAWHGSVALSMRYLNPALPFLAILMGIQLSSLQLIDVFGSKTRFFILSFILWCIILIFTFKLKIHEQEIILLNLPILFIILITSLIIINEIFFARCKKILKISILISIIYSSSIVFSRDYIFEKGIRSFYNSVSVEVTDAISPDAIVITYNPNALWVARAENPNLLIAHDAGRGAEELAALIRAFQEHRPVYWLHIAGGLEDPAWRSRFEQMVALGMTFEPVGSGDLKDGFLRLLRVTIDP